MPPPQQPDPLPEPPPDPPAPLLAAAGSAAPWVWLVPPAAEATPVGDPVPTSGILSPEEVPDEGLLAALVAGESAALGPLYDRYARVVFAVLVRIVGERAVAEELLQEVFLRVWQHAPDFDERRGTVRAWVHGIAHHLALNEVRRRQRRPQEQYRGAHAEAGSAEAVGDVAAGVMAVGADPAADAWCALRNAQLAQALEQLPPRQRAVLLLYAAGLSQSEIAAHLSEPLGTVKSRMRRALWQLRQVLPGCGIDASWRSE